MEVKENGNVPLIAAKEIGNDKLSFVFCKWKTEVCSPWLADDQW